VGAGTDAFDAGAGDDTIEARDRRRETIRCGSGRDRNDRLIGCERVTRRSRRRGGCLS
jgi:hypothetical protein